VLSILEDIKEIRKEKMLKIMRSIDPDTPIKFLSFVGAQEISQLRPVLQEAYGTLNKMQAIKDKAQADQA